MGSRIGVRKAVVLGEKNAPLQFKQSKADSHDALRLEVPSSAPNPDVSVIALDLEGTPSVNTELVQQAGWNRDAQLRARQATG